MTDNPTPLQSDHLPDPVPAEDELLIKVHTCGLCHTELDEIEGRTPPPRLPIILCNQLVGRVAALGVRTGSVANLTRSDEREFLRLAAEVPLRPEVQKYSLVAANQTLIELKAKIIRGAEIPRLA